MVNKAIILGRLGADPEVRTFENGNKVANFNVASNEVYYKKVDNDPSNREKVEKTEWHRVVVWRRQAEIAEKYLKKGDLLYLEGKIRTRSFDDKEGNKRYITEIEADNFQMLSSKSDNAGTGGGGSQGSSNQYQQAPPQQSNEASQGPGELPEQDDDDLPF